MHAYYVIGLIAFLVILAMLVIRFVNATVDKQFRNLARASSESDYRKQEIARLENVLKGVLPLSDSVQPLPGPASGARGALPPVLIILGLILLWGAGAVPAEKREMWLYGGIAALGVAILFMLITLRRRKWARLARLLLFRADLKRMDGDRNGSGADLRELVKLTPWDDSAWAELSDDLASSGDLSGAMEAMEEASRLDPRYDEYHMLQASIAIRQGRYERAWEAVGGWREVGGVDEDDPRLAIYRAAIELGEGKRDEAEETLRKVLDDDDLELIESDQALEGVRALLPGRE